MLKLWLALIPTIVMLLVLFLTLVLPEREKTYKFIKKYLIWIVLVLVLLNALVYSRWAPYWIPVDEGSHFAYIQFLSEKHRLPLLSDYSSNEVLALGDHLYPGEPKFSPKYAGLAGNLYEAFQPPLYYISSVPFYRLAGENFVDKIYFVRFWGALQLCALILFAYKALENLRKLFPKRFEAFALALVAVIGFTPAITLRAITAGNAVMPMVFVTLVLWWMSKFVRDAKREITKKDVLILGVFTALGLLSRFMVLFLIPIIGLFFLLKWKGLVYNFLIYSLVVLALLLPWFAFNKSHYGTYTANGQAKELQMGVVNPNGKRFDLKYIGSSMNHFFIGIWLNEDNNLSKYKKQDADKIMNEMRTMNKIWIAGGIVMAMMSLKIIFVNYIMQHRNDRKRLALYVITLAGLLGAFFQLVAATIASDWPVMLGRYLHPAIVLIGFLYVYLLNETYKLQFLAQRIKYIKENKLLTGGITILLTAVILILVLIPLHINVTYLSYLNPNPK